MDAGGATTEAECTEVLNGNRSGEGGLQRLGGHAQVQRILRTRYVITAAHEWRVREDLVTLPGESCTLGHAKEHLLHHCGHFRTRTESEDSRAIKLCCPRYIGYTSPQRRTVATIGLGRRGSCWVSPTLALGQTCICHPPKPQQSSPGREKKKQLMAPMGKGTPKVKSENISDDDDSLQKEIRAAQKQAFQAKHELQGSKGAKAKDGGAK